VADSLETTLLENVQVNLEDTTTYSDLAAIKDTEIMDEFFLLSRTNVAATIVPGPPEDEQTGVQITRWWQPVKIHLQDRANQTPTRGRTLLGTSGRPGLDTVASFVRRALDRPSPFDGRKPSASYTTQTGVHNVRYMGKEYLGDEDKIASLGEDQTPEDAVATQVLVVTMAYYCVDSRRD
jgi:hypothetical protein